MKNELGGFAIRTTNDPDSNEFILEGDCLMDDGRTLQLQLTKPLDEHVIAMRAIVDPNGNFSEAMPNAYFSDSEIRAFKRETLARCPEIIADENLSPDRPILFIETTYDNLQEQMHKEPALPYKGRDWSPLTYQIAEICEIKRRIRPS
jgi:hypothetical protein